MNIFTKLSEAVDAINASILRNRQMEAERMLAFGMGGMQFLYEYSQDKAYADSKEQASDLPVRDIAGHFAHAVDARSWLALALAHPEALKHAEAARAAWDKQAANRRASDLR